MTTDRRKLPQKMMVELRSPSKGPAKTTLDPQIQDEKMTAGLTEKLVEVTNDEEQSRVVRVGRNLKKGRFDELV